MVQDSPFAGFPDETLTFLARLAANNTRNWFKANRDFYERAYRDPAERFCAAMQERLEAETGVAHEAKVFRIHRDVRFSQDKTPYNAHLHILLKPAASAGACYFGLTPENLVLGAGAIGLDKAQLDAYRSAVAGDHGDVLVPLLERLSGSGAHYDAPELKRVPRGFDPDHAYADLLRRKSLAVWIDAPDVTQATRKTLVDDCMKQFETLRPVNEWLQKALDGA